MNVYDSARMSDVLRPLGYQLTDTPDEADMIILNTCHIRDRATEKVFSELGRLHLIIKKQAQIGKKAILAVAGCVAQAAGEEILKRAPFVDLVLGPQTYHRLPEMIAKVARAGNAVIETNFPVEQKFDFLPDSQLQQFPGGVSAFLTIQEGCDKFCSFCVVPYTRGAENNRPARSIIKEARHLISLGAREITLLGQNVNAYQGEGLDGHSWSLARLIYALARIPDLLRIRYTTSHPRDMQDDLITAHAELPKLMPFIHLPVQSGSDRILKIMNRGHTIADYLRLIDQLRLKRPDIALSSDFIVGHPGETDNDFQATLQLIRDVGFSQAFSFKYSPRPGTPAANFSTQIDDSVKSDRLQELQSLLRQQQNTFNADFLGRVIPVLFTGMGRKHTQITGKTPYMQAVNLVAPSNAIGQESLVKITNILTNSLSGVLSAQENKFESIHN